MNFLFRLLLLATSLSSLNLAHSQIAIDAYCKEIKALQTEEAIDAYWKHLEILDQKVQLHSDNVRQHDSISLSLLTRTALMFEIHGPKSYKPNNTVPMLNIAHNWNGEALLAFWPIILECKKTGGVIDVFGGTYPAYELEAISMAFYRFSLFNQEDKYDALMKHIKVSEDKPISKKLFEIYNKDLELYRLSEKEANGKWFIQSFKDTKEVETFEFVTMSNGLLYVKTGERIQKLILTDTKEKSKLFRIENEPFGWVYELTNDGYLSLKDEQGTTLINYTKV
ncbi:hypothetical protein [Mangrovimonas futianensis]|uniref:hypothetical protein n=1 Tax=Mangrovimonas futianensis TaxID=2895523 RepID=UPI001E6588BF|nr:hypothetical protein [Mangrovimonas futianensis]MCF1422612.1 hypothetical protein [Mangrovimonas futianensis]